MGSCGNTLQDLDQGITKLLDNQMYNLLAFKLLNLFNQSVKSKS